RIAIRPTITVRRRMVRRGAAEFAPSLSFAAAAGKRRWIGRVRLAASRTRPTCEPTKSGFGWRGALDSRQPADFPDTEGRSGVLLYSGRALLFCRRQATKKAKKQLRRRAFAQLSSLIALWVALDWSVKQGNAYYGEYSTQTEAPRLPQRPHYASNNNRSTIVCAACGLARRCTLACMIASRCGSARSWSIL